MNQGKKYPERVPGRPNPHLMSSKLLERLGPGRRRRGVEEEATAAVVSGL